MLQIDVDLAAVTADNREEEQRWSETTAPNETITNTRQVLQQ